MFYDNTRRRQRPTNVSIKLIAIFSAFAVNAFAQATTGPSKSEAINALAKQSGDVDNTTVLQETLTATDKRYSMLRSGKFAATYDLSYSYIGEQLIEADFTAEDLTNFQIENTRGHTLRNIASVDYGILDNLTTNVSLPLVSKYSDTDEIDGDAHSVGDVSVGMRFQPFSLTQDWPAVTLNATAFFPTGRSPFDASERELATGSGHGAFSVGLNASKVIDPVAIFGSLSFTHNFKEDGLDFVRDEQVLREVDPSYGIGWGVGFAYAMSYDITTTMSFQQYFQDATELVFEDADGNQQRTETGNQTSALLNVGLGVRLAATTLNFAVGIGLTPDSPDFTFGINAPIRF